MKWLNVGIIAVISLFVCSVNALAQGPTRITFAKGATSKVVSGSLTDYKGHVSFVINVKKGQTLVTESIGKNRILLEVRPPENTNFEADMEADCHGKQEVHPTVAGDYTINVYECQKADPWKGTFKLRVSVR